MTVPVTEYFRILVVGKEQGDAIAGLIENHLGFKTTVCSEDEVSSAVRNGADLGAIITSRAGAEATIKVRAERGLRMPVFMLSRREDEVFGEPYLKELEGVFIADLECWFPLRTEPVRRIISIEN